MFKFQYNDFAILGCSLNDIFFKNVKLHVCEQVLSSTESLHLQHDSNKLTGKSFEKGDSITPMNEYIPTMPLHFITHLNST